MTDNEPEDVEFLQEDLKGDPSVPPELLELHLELEIAGTTVEEFQSAFGNP